MTDLTTDPTADPTTERRLIRQRPFGRTGEMVSELALGTWGLSGDASGPVYHTEVERVIDRAIEAGITLFDTADVYGKGEMEKKLAEKLDADQHRLVTKIGTFLDEEPPQKRFDAERLARAFEACRERQGRDRLDVVLLHNPSLAALEGEGPDYLKERVAADEIGHWGVSCGSGAVAKAAIDRGAAVIEIAYNLLWQDDFAIVRARAEATETAVLARSVLAHGLLAGHWSRNKVFFDNDHRKQRWTKDALRHRLGQLDAVRSLVGGDVITLRAAALRFVLSSSVVTAAVLGPRSVTQLNQLILEAGEGPPYLDVEVLEELPARLEAVGLTVASGEPESGDVSAVGAVT
jgi:aryl-alcohol dehydrogenase-like predicted oxidoreductase